MNPPSQIHSPARLVIAVSTATPEGTITSRMKDHRVPLTLESRLSVANISGTSDVEVVTRCVSTRPVLGLNREFTLLSSCRSRPTIRRSLGLSLTKPNTLLINPSVCPASRHGPSFRIQYP